MKSYIVFAPPYALICHIVTLRTISPYFTLMLFLCIYHYFGTAI